MILVDSSVWIDLITGASGIFTTALRALIDDMQDIGLTDVNLMEVLRGIRDDAQYHKVKSSLCAFNIISATGTSTYVHAADLYREARKNGLTVNSTFDCLIAQIAIENKASILTKDNDFARLAKIRPEIKITDPNAILSL